MKQNQRRNIRVRAGYSNSALTGYLRHLPGTIHTICTETQHFTRLAEGAMRDTFAAMAHGNLETTFSLQNSQLPSNFTSHQSPTMRKGTYVLARLPNQPLLTVFSHVQAICKSTAWLLPCTNGWANTTYRSWTVRTNNAIVA